MARLAKISKKKVKPIIEMATCIAGVGFVVAAEVAHSGMERS